MNESNQINRAETKSDNLTCSLNTTFASLIQRAINLGSGYRQKSREIAAIHYAAVKQYDIDESNRDAYEAELKKLCVENKIEVTPGKTSPYHMIVRLTFTDATKQYISDKVHVLSVALAKQVKPENFLVWLENERGERKIVETYKRDGSRKQEDDCDDDQEEKPNGSHRERNRNEQIQRAREQLSNSFVFKIDAATTSQALPEFRIDTECAAIVVRHTDGSIVIKAVVADQGIAENVYAGYYRANSHEIDAAIQQMKISEMLENSDSLSLTDIRKELGDEIADKAAEATSQASEFNREMANTPESLKKYVELLKKADLVYGTSGALSFASFYERAIEELEQVLEDDPSLQGYLDRSFDRTVTLCPENMPRLIGSKSKHANSVPLATKQSALRDTLKSELAILRGMEA